MTFITDTIAIGNCMDAENRPALQEVGIRSILCLNNQLNGRLALELDMEALRVFDLTDGKGNDPRAFADAVDAVRALSTRHPKLLVHCTAGRSRSVMVVAAHLVQTNNWDMSHALWLIHEKRPETLPPQELIKMWDVGADGRVYAGRRRR